MFRKLLIVPALTCAALSGCQQHGLAGDHQDPGQTQTAQRQASNSESTSEASFRKDMAIDDIKRVQYRGADGQSLTFAQFMAIVQAGRSFSKTVNSKESLAVLTVNKQDARGSTGSDDGNRLNMHIGAMLPPIDQRDLAGHLTVLANGKKYTLLSFFFNGCVPCIQEAPALTALADEAKNMNVVSITFDSSAVASQFAKQRGLKTLIIPNAQKYIDAVGVKVYPTLILVSPDGRFVGARTSYEVSGGQASALADLKEWLNSLGFKT